MNETTAAKPVNRFGPVLPPRTLAGFVAAIVTVMLIALFGYRSLDTTDESTDLTTYTFQVMQRVDTLMSSIKDAETGQRGYLLTGRETYLEPFSEARASIPGQVQELRRLTLSNPRQQQLLSEIERLANDKLSELQGTVELKRAGESERALELVLSDRGRLTMDRVRDVTSQFLDEDRSLLASRLAATNEASEVTVGIVMGGSAILFVLIITAGFLTSRDFLTQQTEAWLQSGQTGLSERMQGEQRLETLGENILGFLARYLGAQVGAIYLREPSGALRRFASFALPAGKEADTLSSGEGLAGQALKEDRVVRVDDVPAGHLPVASALGESRPAHLLIAPASESGTVQAVVELGFLRAPVPSDSDLLRRARESIAIAVRSSKDRTLLEELLEETQRQSEELQTQQEELRVANEELARSNQYKLEFLANMSHELRTPLNSSLILAKLLADNKQGNLSEEQVKFAQTIFG